MKIQFFANQEHDIVIITWLQNPSSKDYKNQNSSSVWGKKKKRKKISKIFHLTIKSQKN